MAEFTTKRYLDLEGLRSFWGKAKEFIAAGYDVKGAAATAESNAKSYAKDYADGLKTTIDTAYAAADATTLASAKSYADGLAVNYDAKGAAATAESNAKSYTDGKVKDINDAAGLLAGRVSTAESEIDSLQAAVEVLNGEASAEGSVKKQVADAVAGVVASAPSDFDTLKEIADYIASDKTGAAEMNNAISTNAKAIEKLNGEGEGSVKAAVKAEETRAMGIEEGLAERIAILEAEAGLGGEEGAGQTLAEKVQANTTAIATNTSNITTLMGEANVEGSVKKAVADLKGDATYETMGALEDAFQGHVEVYNQHVEANVASFEAVRADFAAEDTKLSGRIDTVSGRIDAIVNDTTGILAQAKVYTDTEAGKVYASIEAIPLEGEKSIASLFA